jgi:aminopeptidase-like protein
MAGKTICYMAILKGILKKMNKAANFRAKRMRNLLEEINPLQRMVNSPGLDRTFEIFKREFPNSIIHEYPAGMEREDWIVPRSWEMVSGIMTDKNGKIIASSTECELFIAPYSESVEGWFTKEEIAIHLMTRKDVPDLFLLQHRNTYDHQLNDWGITLPYNRWQNLPDEKFFIKIDVKWGQGTMKVGEYFLPGKRKDVLCICAHIDERCNDDLSGCILGLEIMKELEKIPEREFSYQLLWVPEMFGPLFYADDNPEVIRNTFGMLNLEAVGAGEQWCMKKAWKADTRLERMLRNAMKSSGIPFEELEFFEGYINDEKVYAWPKINIQGVAIQRYPFKEYHTSGDVVELIEDKLMLESLEFSEKLIGILENDYIPEYSGNLPPWLTRRKIYFDSKLDPENHNKYNNHLLYNIDGKLSVMDLAELTGLKFELVIDYLDKLTNSGIIKKKKLLLT